MTATSAIPFDDFGGRGQVLHFAHANAYPPGSYRQMLEHLTHKYRVLAIRHRPLWPGSDPGEIGSWQPIAEDLVHFFEQVGLDDVIGVGHSLGAVATAMAAVMRPRLFRALILIEPVFLPPALLERITSLTNEKVILEHPLIITTRKRCDEWSSQQEAFAHYRQKSVFDRLTDEALWDYVTSGLKEDDGQWRLTYRPAWEARIYALPANDVWSIIPLITQPTLALRGVETATLMSEAWELWQRKQPGAIFVEFEGAGHLLPLEQPLAVAQIIDSFIEGLESNRS